MAQKTRVIIQNPDTGTTYETRKAIKGDAANVKLSMRKFDKKIRAHADFVEIKKLRSLKKGKK